ncbi:peroxisomal carnitine O-octanoyltransferase-like [Liolophura sinensis]|uniref:peroxisomal carnitine O-octanoyltransferase-like n=1 Tax=Liolophura sinensis TaxID=3198878 RepID=UPI0031583012
MDPDAVFTTESDSTFAHQESLPSLPIPPLDQTLSKYLDSIRPHVTNEEYLKTERLVRRFEEGAGRDLHRKLMSRATHQRNWLEKWWDEKAYLELRIPTGIMVNLGGPTIVPQFWAAKEGTQCERAAMWIYYAMKYWGHLRKERLRPDRTNKGAVMSMNQYRRAFNTCKIPGLKKDQLLCHFKTEREGDCPTHVAVMCRGRIFTFDTFHAETDTQLTPPELEAQLSHIRSVCDSSAEGPGVGSLTGDERTPWAKIRARMISSHPENWACLQAIETAVVAVVLDDDSPRDESELLLRTLAGNSVNRWLDKSYSFIVHKNGLSSANCDHAPFEGVILVSLLNYVGMCLQRCGGQWQGTRSLRQLPNPRELVFHLEEAVLLSIKRARAVYDAVAKNLEVRVSEFRDYGKTFLRQHKLHPDTHVQLALQYAYYKTYARPAPTYETATTRQFYNGRTETVRSCTMEAMAWSKVMLDSGKPTSERLRLYLLAADKQNKLMEEAQSNHGCDRHLFGLYCLAEEEGMPIPEIFTDPSYSKSGGGGNFILSTSFLGYSPVYGGVVPMCENGYCVAYCIQNKLLTTVVTSWVSDKDTDCNQFTDTIHACLRQMGSLVQHREATARL